MWSAYCRRHILDWDGWMVSTIFFYADNGRIAGRNPIWVNNTLATVVRLFKRVVMKKMGKTEVMVCNPGFICRQQGEEAYKQRSTVRRTSSGRVRELG